MKIPLVAALISMAFILYTTVVDAKPVDTAVVFLVDMSSSMSSEEKRIARESHASAIKSREVLTAIKGGYHQRSAFAYIEFATRADTVVDWMVVDGHEAAAAFSSGIRNNKRGRIGDQTAIGQGMAEALRVIKEMPYAANDVVLDIAGDGFNNFGIDVDDPRQELLDMGVSINGLPMLIQPVSLAARPEYSDLADYYDKAITGGPMSFNMPLERIEDMPTMMRRKIVIELGAL